MWLVLALGFILGFFVIVNYKLIPDKVKEYFSEKTGQNVIEEAGKVISNLKTTEAAAIESNNKLTALLEKNRGQFTKLRVESGTIHIDQRNFPT